MIISEDVYLNHFLIGFLIIIKNITEIITDNIPDLKIVGKGIYGWPSSVIGGAIKSMIEYMTTYIKNKKIKVIKRDVRIVFIGIGCLFYYYLFHNFVSHSFSSLELF